MSKRLYIKTYGCQMNVYDSRRMTDVLGPLGYVATDAPESADLVILNTCHIREKAAEKLFSDLGRLKPLQQARRSAGERMVLAVAGCVAQAEGAELIRRAPFVDIVIGPQTYHRLPDLLASAIEADQTQLIDTEFPDETKFDLMPARSGETEVSSFLTIQEGCDKFCTFCVVPYTRGAEYSRPVSSVLEEARTLVAAGARELVLLGQNVNAYHGVRADGGSASLAQLLAELAQIPGLERLRYTTSHPRDVDAALIEVHAEIPQVMPFLHLPVQSGSDRILAAMNRKHRIADYLRLIEQFRNRRPDMAFSSDFIVGYPGESDADFEATLELVHEVGFATAYSFRYSPRSGTPAAAAADVVPDAVARERLSVLQAVLEHQQRAYNVGKIGTVQEVLFERAGRHSGQMIGRTPFMQGVHCVAPGEMQGTVRSVAISGATLNSLAGHLIETPQVLAA